MSGTETRRRERQVSVRLLPEEWALIQAEAKVNGVSPGELLRRAYFQPRCQHVSVSPWGPAQCVLADGHDDRHAYSPGEATP